MTAIQTGEENEEAVFKPVDYYLETERRQDAISLLEVRRQERRIRKPLRQNLCLLPENISL